MNKISLLVLVSIVAFFSCSKVKKEKAKPNIILLYVDDMGLGDASFTSGKVRPTPNIDRLAAEGKVFTNYYSGSPVCSPSRVAITTGMYPMKWNINTFLSSKKHNRLCDQSDYLKSYAPTIAKTLKAAGYNTAHFGKWHMGGGRDVKNAPSITKYGFDKYKSTYESPDPDPLLTSTNWIWAPTDSIKRWERTAYFVDKTLDFLKHHPQQPCFVDLWPDDVHSPWVPDEESEKDWKQHAFTLPKLQPVITEFDRQVGRLIDGLKKLGVYNNTLIVFTSDNGPKPPFDQLRTNGLRGCKNSLYEGGIKMPFFVWWPGVIKPGQVDSVSVISAVDMLPTLCSIGNGTLPKNEAFDGEDISAEFLNQDVRVPERYIYWAYGRMNKKYSVPKDPINRSPDLAIRHGVWKLFTNFDGTSTELYNVKNDPDEHANVVADHPHIANTMKSKLLKWFHDNDKLEIK